MTPRIFGGHHCSLKMSSLYRFTDIPSPDLCVITTLPAITSATQVQTVRLNVSREGNRWKCGNNAVVTRRSREVWAKVCR